MHLLYLLYECYVGGRNRPLYIMWFQWNVYVCLVMPVAEINHIMWWYTISNSPVIMSIIFDYGCHRNGFPCYYFLNLIIYCFLETFLFFIVILFWFITWCVFLLFKYCSKYCHRNWQFENSLLFVWNTSLCLNIVF